jgi:hypothetical protein
MSTPEILPENRQLNRLISDDYSDMAELLAEIYSSDNTFVDVDLEQRYPDVISIVDKVARSYMNDTTYSDELYHALYEAFFFAFTAARAISLSDNPGVYISDYYNQPVDQLFDAMTTDAKEFLSTRPAIANLITAFNNSIDTSGNYLEAANIFAAVTFSQIEADEREHYIAESLAEFALNLKKY